MPLITLSHHGERHPTPLDLPPSTTLQTLHEKILQHLSLPTGTGLRLIHKGKTVPSTATTLSETSLTDAEATLYILSTSPSTISAIRAAKPDPLLRPFSAPNPRYVAAPRSTRDVTALNSSYGFGRVEALPGFADTARATAILEQLASDKGFLDVMRRKGWRVGALKEMPPEGKVGVDPVCVLGYNTNKGMEIHLRLRTDDRKGFRPMRMIRQVLAHELAHNVFSEHDDKFKELMRWIEREAAKKDWRTGGNVVGGVAAPIGQVQGVDPLQEFQEANQRPGLHFVGRLGSASDSQGRSGLPLSESPGAAAWAQPAQESKSVRENVDTVHSGEHQRSRDEQLQLPDENLSEQGSKLASSPVTSPEREPDPMDTSAPITPSTSASTPNPKASAAPVSPQKPRNSAVEQLSGLGFSRGLATLALRENGRDATRAADWLLTLSASGSSSRQVMSDENASVTRRAEGAVARLCSSGLSHERLVSALDAVHLYLSNALRNPGVERFASINATNSGFQRRVGVHECATALLETAGFRLDDDGVWRYRSMDSARLWVTKGIVQDRLVEELRR